MRKKSRVACMTLLALLLYITIAGSAGTAWAETPAFPDAEAFSADGSSEVRIILHEQDGTVYAYLLNYTDGYEPDADGNIVCSSPYYSFRWRLIFDREQAFLLGLPN